MQQIFLKYIGFKINCEIKNYPKQFCQRKGSNLSLTALNMHGYTALILGIFSRLQLTGFIQTKLRLQM